MYKCNKCYKCIRETESQDMFEMDIKRGSNRLCLPTTRGKVWKNINISTQVHLFVHMYHYTVHQYGNIHAYMYIVRSGTKAFLRERVARGGGRFDPGLTT